MLTLLLFLSLSFFFSSLFRLGNCLYSLTYVDHRIVISIHVLVGDSNIPQPTINWHWKIMLPWFVSAPRDPFLQSPKRLIHRPSQCLLHPYYHYISIANLYSRYSTTNSSSYQNFYYLLTIKLLAPSYVLLSLTNTMIVLSINLLLSKQYTTNYQYHQ